MRLSDPRQAFYGWRIVGVGLLMHMLLGGLVMQAFGAYGAILRDEFGWSKTVIAAGFALTRVESGFLGPIQGWLIDRLGPRLMMRVGIAIASVGLLLFSQIDTQLEFFGAYFLVAVGTSMGGFLTVSVAIVRWFRRRRATAIGLMATGMAIGGLFAPLVVFSLEELGWRETAFGSGVLIFFAGQALASVMRNDPAELGLGPDGERLAAQPLPKPTEQRRPPDPNDYTAREALRTRVFWYIAIGHGASLLVVSAVMVHLVLHVNESLGFTLGQAGLAIAIMTAFQIVGQLGGGWAGDRFAKHKIVFFSLLGHAIGLLVLAYANTFWMVVVFALLHGGAWGIRGPSITAMRADYFGTAAYGTIMGFSSMVMMIGMTAGPLVAGILADETGDYELGFTLLGILAGLGSIVFLFATHPGPPPHRKRELLEEKQAQAAVPGSVAPAAGDSGG